VEAILKRSAQVEYPQRLRYAFSEMAVGDSVFIEDHRKAESARISAIQYCKRHQLGWRFSIRKMDRGWRLFRIE
jgi:hypothetical protein